MEKKSKKIKKNEGTSHTKKENEMQFFFFEKKGAGFQRRAVTS